MQRTKQVTHQHHTKVTVRKESNKCNKNNKNNKIRTLKNKRTRKILLTALATHQDTIQAINKANIDLYLEKPWKKEELVLAVSTMLTHFILDSGLAYTPYVSLLNSEILFTKLRNASDV